jgi:purine catabolism regulator
VSLTVRSVLALPVLRRGVPEVVAGGEQLDRPVRWVHAAEVPGIATLLKGGELLLTTGMGIDAKAAGQRAIAAALAERQIAGLVLELGTTFASVPAALTAACAQHGLPLVVLHRQVPFVEVTEAVHAEIVEQRFALMARGEELHRRFTDLMLAGAGVPEVLDALAEATGNPVLLQRTGGDVVYHAAHGVPQRDLLAGWDAYERGLPSAPAAVERPVPSGDAGGTSGRLVALALQRSLDGFDGVALERAVALVGLTLLYSRSEDVLAHRERGDFLADVLRGTLGEADASSRAAGFDFHADALLPVAIGRRAPRVGRLTAGEDARWTHVWREMRRELEARHTPALLGGADEGTLLVLGLRADEARTAAADRAAELIGAAAARQLGSAHAAVVCVGPAAGSWSALTTAMQQALAALPAAAQAAERPWHDVEQPDLDRLLWSLRSQDELRAFVRARLGPVIEHDRVRSAKLLPTLEALCLHGGRKAATARALHLERPSLYHRIARLERLLGASISDPDTLLGVHLALRARRHLGD